MIPGFQPPAKSYHYILCHVRRVKSKAVRDEGRGITVSSLRGPEQLGIGRRLHHQAKHEFSSDENLPLSQPPPFRTQLVPANAQPPSKRRKGDNLDKRDEFGFDTLPFPNFPPSGEAKQQLIELL